MPLSPFLQASEGSVPWSANLITARGAALPSQAGQTGGWGRWAGVGGGRLHSTSPLGENQPRLALRATVAFFLPETRLSSVV